MKSIDIYRKIKKEKVICILRGISIEQVVPIAEALHKGGIRLMEIACNTKNALKMIEKVSQTMADKMIIGAGTVINKKACKEVLSAGAKFIIAPNVAPDVISFCVAKDVAVIPGAMTPTEIVNANQLGATMVKIFPAAYLGTGYIKQIRGPIDNVDFVAVGGIGMENISEFLSAGYCAAGLGSTLVPRTAVEKTNWDELTGLSEKILKKVRDTKDA
jgi:2-dehydro-3-deoxyphosphogluconate aldolase/(4S)-4-hydroxy-2-oxoglutarate aldolase